jgi:hypothetical protein
LAKFAKYALIRAHPCHDVVCSRRGGEKGEGGHGGDGGRGGRGGGGLGGRGPILIPRQSPCPWVALFEFLDRTLAHIGPQGRRGHESASGHRQYDISVLFRSLSLFFYIYIL